MEKSITLRASIQMNPDGLKDGLAQVKSVRRQLEANPVRVPVKLDLSGMRAEVARATREINKELAKGMASMKPGGGHGVSAGGIIIPAGAMGEVKKFTGEVQGAYKKVIDQNGKAVRSFHQLEAGYQRVYSKKKGKDVFFDTDTRDLAAFQQRIKDIERKYSGLLGKAKGNKGDVASLLADKKQRIKDVLLDPDLPKSILNTPAYLKADSSLDRLTEKAENAAGTQSQRSARAAKADRVAEMRKALAKVDELTSGPIGKARGSGVGLADELSSRRAMIETQLRAFADLEGSGVYRQAQKALTNLEGTGVQARTAENKRRDKATALQARRDAAAAKADFKRRSTAFIERTDGRINREYGKQSKAMESIARRETGQFDREQAINRVLADRTAMLNRHIAMYERLAAAAKGRGYHEDARRYGNAASRLIGQREQIMLEGTRAETGRMNALSAHQLRSAHDREMANYKARMDQLKTMEANARRELTGGAQRRARENIGSARQALHGETMGRLSGVWREADRRGDYATKEKAMKSLETVQARGLATTRRMDAATRNSGRAFNFHTSSLLRNAATFTKWYVPAQLVMGAFRVLGQGISGAVEAQRSFKILEAVYRGSAEEAKTLADQTLILAAANGRSVQEAAEASVAWARMGLTRTQILVGMESSLRAANVAEISAAEATAYLTANYKAFGQTIADIPATLDYINALSNRNAVAPKQIFEGLSRSAVIAKEAGVTFQELAAIIATVSAETQRPGAEIGNAVKSLSTRLRRPATVRKLKNEFDYDVTTAEGDAKRMTTILGELADIYPKLNRLEKGRLEDMVAGAHQGNRFASVMNNWTEILGAQADVGLETNSALKENAKILESVSSKLEQLNTTWTRLFHTLGEGGVFDVINDGLTGTSITLDRVIRKIREASKWMDRPGIIQDGIRVGRKNMTLPIGTAWNAAIRSGMYLLDTGREENSRPRANAIARTESSAKAQQVTADGNRVEGLFAMSAYFNSLSKSFGSHDANPEKQIEGFDKRLLALSTAEGVPEGSRIANQARKMLRPFLTGGDTAKAREGLQALADDMWSVAEAQRQAGNAFAAGAAAETSAALADIQKKQSVLHDAMAATSDEGAQEAYRKDLANTNDAIKEITDNLGKMKGVMTDRKQEAFTKDMEEKLKSFAKEITTVSKVYGELLGGFAGTGFPQVDAALMAGQAGMERNMWRGIISRSREDDERLSSEEDAILDRIRTDPANLYSADRGRILDAREKRRTSISQAEAFMMDLDEPTEAALREVEARRQADAIRRAAEDARRSTGSGFSRYDVGLSEGERLASRGYGIMSEIGRDIQRPLGSGNATRDARELASLTERMAQARENQFGMEDRMNRALAERKNLELTITEEKRRQNEESAKTLALASREDQLRAATAAAYQRSRGGRQMSMEEFRFFSQETRGAIANYNPRSVKGLDDSGRDQSRRRQELDREIGGIAISLKSLRDGLNAVLPTAERRASGIIDVENPFAPGAAPTADRITDLDTATPRINLNTGPISVRLDIAPHIRDMTGMLQSRFDSQFSELAREMKTMFAVNRALDMSGVEAAF